MYTQATEETHTLIVKIYSIKDKFSVRKFNSVRKWKKKHEIICNLGTK